MSILYLYILYICTSDHIDVSKINDLAKSIALRHLDDAYMIYWDNNKQAISRLDIAWNKQTSRTISIVVKILSEAKVMQLNIVQLFNKQVKAAAKVVQ